MMLRTAKSAALSCVPGIFINSMSSPKDRPYKAPIKNTGLYNPVGSSKMEQRSAVITLQPQYVANTTLCP